MITELEDGLKSCSLVILAIFLWCILPLFLKWVGINLYSISNQVLIKLDQVKVINAYSPVHYIAFAFILSPHLLSMTCAHLAINNVAQKEEATLKCCEDVAGTRRTQRPVDCQ
jgi:hypothetical protein